MDSNRHEDLGEMYSPDDQGKYTSLDEALRFSVQGLSDVLADVGEGMDETPAEEYAMMLEEFNLKLKPSKCSFFQLEIVYLAHHVSWRGILPS